MCKPTNGTAFHDKATRCILQHASRSIQTCATDDEDILDCLIRQTLQEQSPTSCADGPSSYKGMEGLSYALKSIPSLEKILSYTQTAPKVPVEDSKRKRWDPATQNHAADQEQSDLQASPEQSDLQASPLEETSASAPSEKRRRVQSRSPDSTLHLACSRGSESEINRVLDTRPHLSSIPASIETTKSSYDPVTRSVRTRRTRESFRFPLNLAVRSKVAPTTIERLVEAAPEVLLLPDGPMRESSLSVLLKTAPQDVMSADIMLLTKPKVASVKDRHGNTALHVAASVGSCLDIVRHLCALHPEAVVNRNFHGLTPLDLARRQSACSDQVATYLLEVEETVLGIPALTSPQCSM